MLMVCVCFFRELYTAGGSYGRHRCEQFQPPYRCCVVTSLQGDFVVLPGKKKMHSMNLGVLRMQLSWRKLVHFKKETGSPPSPPLSNVFMDWKQSCVLSFPTLYFLAVEMEAADKLENISTPSGELLLSSLLENKPASDILLQSLGV